MPTIVITENTTVQYSGSWDNQYTGVDDQQFSEGSPSSVQNQSQIEASSYTVAGDQRRSAIKATNTALSNIPAGATITNVIVRLYQFDFFAGTESNVALYECLKLWVEGQITWNNYSTGNAWTSAGCSSAGSDYVNTILAQYNNTSGTNGYVEFTGTGLVDWMQDIIDAVISNYGLFITQTAPANFQTNVYRRSTGTDGQRPEIVISYTTGGVTVALTGIGNTYSAGSLSGSVNKALTGSAQTASQGTLVKVHSKALTNNAINASQGALASAIAFALTGQAFTYTQGTVTPDATSNINVALTGQQYAFAQGNVTASTIKALTGQQATETAGNLAKSISKAITGQGSTFALGSLGSSVTTPLIGGSSSYSQGNLSPTGALNIQLTGSTFSYTAGTLTASSSKELTGQSATLSQGTLAGLIARALSGQGHTVSQGTLTPSNAIEIQLTGQQASYSQGFLTASLSKQLIGSVATYRQGTLSVFGQVIPQYPLDGAVITYPLAGSNINYPLGT